MNGWKRDKTSSGSPILRRSNSKRKIKVTVLTGEARPCFDHNGETWCDREHWSVACLATPSGTTAMSVCMLDVDYDSIQWTPKSG